jgi:hypothetical protein
VVVSEKALGERGASEYNSRTLWARHVGDGVLLFNVSWPFREWESSNAEQQYEFERVTRN